MNSLRALIRLLAEGPRESGVRFERADANFMEAITTDYAANAQFPNLSPSLSWQEVAALVILHKRFWACVPLSALDPNVLDVRPLAHAMTRSLIADPSVEDFRAVHSIIKRLRRYLVYGRPPTPISRAEFLQLLRSQNGRCNCCGHWFTDDDLAARDYVGEPSSSAQLGNLRPPQVDHIVPIFLAGHRLSNCQILCLQCNGSKGAAALWPLKAALAGPYRPSDIFELSGAVRYMVLARDARCGDCGQEPRALARGVELRPVRIDPECGWLLENLRAVCTRCCSGAQASVPPYLRHSRTGESVETESLSVDDYEGS